MFSRFFFSVNVTIKKKRYWRKERERTTHYRYVDGMGKLLHLMLFILCCCCSFNIFLPSLFFARLQCSFSYFMFMPILITHTASKHKKIVCINIVRTKLMWVRDECSFILLFFSSLFSRWKKLKDAWKRKSNFLLVYVLLLFRWKEIFIALHDWDALWLIHMESKNVFFYKKKTQPTNRDWRVLKGWRKKICRKIANMLISCSIWINILMEFF